MRRWLIFDFDRNTGWRLSIVIGLKMVGMNSSLSKDFWPFESEMALKEDNRALWFLY
jgi:hypothetical protein